MTGTAASDIVAMAATMAGVGAGTETETDGTTMVAGQAAMGTQAGISTGTETTTSRTITPVRTTGMGMGMGMVMVVGGYRRVLRMRTGYWTTMWTTSLGMQGRSSCSSS